MKKENGNWEKFRPIPFIYGVRFGRIVNFLIPIFVLYHFSINHVLLSQQIRIKKKTNCRKTLINNENQ